MTIDPGRYTTGNLAMTMTPVESLKWKRRNLTFTVRMLIQSLPIGQSMTVVVDNDLNVIYGHDICEAAKRAGIKQVRTHGGPVLAHPCG